MFGNLHQLPLAVVFLGLGISSIIYTPAEFLFDVRLRMIPGTPPYSFWADPPDNLLAKAYIFNVTNSERFLEGIDTDLHLEEIGPIIFREKLVHTNIVHNSNSTLTYTVTRNLEYLPERNTIDLNATIIAPNLAMLTMASYFSDSSFFVKAGLNILLNRYKSQPFVNISIYDFLHNATDPVLEPAKLIAGGLVPSKNVGVLSQMYLKNSYNITVLIGPKYGNEDYFSIENIDGLDSVPTFKRCKPKFHHTSETTLFPQLLRKDQRVGAWKSVLCMAVDAVFVNETSRYGMTGYRYEVPPTTFNRTEPEHDDCYRGNSLPNGLADVSTCYNNYPFAASFPHFMSADPIVSNRIKGLKPDPARHVSFLNLERMSGVPMSGRAIFQINLIFRKMTGFGKKIEKFSDMYLPFAYVGYEIEGLPLLIQITLYIMSIVVPNTQFIMSAIFITVGLLFLYYFNRDFRKLAVINNNNNNKSYLALNESEKFIRIDS